MQKITGEKLAACIHNTLRKEIKETGAVACSRFTDAQLEVYNTTDIFRVRAKLPACITLDFYTDATEMAVDFTVLYTGPWGNTSIADLYVDGVFLQEVNFPIHPAVAEHLIFSLPDGNKRVTFWFSKQLQITVDALYLTDGASCSFLPERKKYLALGDSITFSSAPHPSFAYTSQVARRFDFELINQAVGGYVFCADSLDADLPLKPDIITVAYGTNDNRSDVAAYRKRVADYLNKLCEIFPGVPTLVITPLWRMDLSGSAGFERIYPEIEAESATHPQISVLDGRKVLPHRSFVFGDEFLHPNDLGMTLYAQAVGDAIEKMLEPDK